MSSNNQNPSGKSPADNGGGGNEVSRRLTRLEGQMIRMEERMEHKASEAYVEQAVNRMLENAHQDTTRMLENMNRLALWAFGIMVTIIVSFVAMLRFWAG